MAKNKNKASADRKRDASFAAAAVILGGLILTSLVMFGISSLLHGESSRKLNESLYPVKYEYYVESYAKEFNVDVCLVYGVIRTESNFDPNAVSQAGAIGLMQLMPDTFTWLQNYRTEFMPDKLLDSSELYKPQVNIEYGTYLLRYLLDRYNGDTSLAIIAYNAGYGNVDTWLADGTIPQSGVTSDAVPFSETANYLTRVTESMEMYRQLYYSDYEQTFESSSASDYSSAEEQPEMTDTESDIYNDPELFYDNDSTYYYDEDDGYAFEGDGTGVYYEDENYY